MSASLTVLGAGAILPQPGRGCAGYALRLADGTVTLLDCGPGSVRMLGSVGIALGDVRRVVLSHYHLDHCLDLFALSFARHNPAFAPPPHLDVFGPVGLAALVAGAPDGLGRWARDPDVTHHEVAVGGDGRGGFEVEGARFTCVANDHTPNAVSWRVDVAGGASLLYTGDTGPNAVVADLGRGVDLFLAECSFPDERATSNHLSPSSAATLASSAGAARLALTHFYPGTDPERARATAAETFDGPIEVCADGSSLFLE